MRQLVDGSTAIVRGALDAGCDFFAGYPITPASPILMSMMEELPRRGGVAVQGEDEIASMGLCIGAVMAGRRALTATSGPGISLYSESIGLALMGEVPMVIVDVQRLGPATGGATTVGQGDVQFVRWGTGGGFPVIVLAPSSVAECYTLTMRAFDLSERFRCPVFLLTDKELNLTLSTVPAEDFHPVPVWARPHAGDGDGDGLEVAQGNGHGGPPRPYQYSPSDEVPPLRHYGELGGLRFTGSTHDERAVITKTPQTVGALNRHLIDKIEAHREEIDDVDLDLAVGATTLVVSFGVTAGAVREAVATARAAGDRHPPVSAAIVRSLWPVPESALHRALDGVERVVVAELNPGLYRREVERLAAGCEVVGVHRLDGEMIAPEEILEALS